MCTAVSMQMGDHYFGRNLDLEYGYDEQITLTPRRFGLNFRKTAPLKEHYAILGMAYVVQGYPLYYDGFNEKGLAMAGLNFPGNGVYLACRPDRENLAPFELIPYVLGSCGSLEEAERLLRRVNLADIHFDPKLPNTPLHWLVADGGGSLVVEQTADGLHLFRNPVGVLANNPPFDWHMTNLCNYMALSPAQPKNNFASSLELAPYSRGMGGIGLPGDFSSASRFVRAAFVLHNTLAGSTEEENISRFFHILDGVAMPFGCVQTDEGKQEYTRYSCCCNTTGGIYYYTTHENRAITAVEMHREELEGSRLVTYPMDTRPKIFRQNQKGGQATRAGRFFGKGDQK